VVTVTGGADVPLDPRRNTAAVGVAAMLDALAPGHGIELRIEKGIPIGSGIGGSAASAVAGVVAANAILGEPFGTLELLRYAILGESVASGAVHADNVAPALLGGLVLVRSAETQDLLQLPVPSWLRCVVVLPQLQVATREARAVLPAAFALATVVRQSANLAAMIAGLHAGDPELLARSMQDQMIEPHRASLIRGFREVQSAALGAGALACSLSGAGPAVFAWCDGEGAAAAVREAMVAGFASNGVPAEGWVSLVSAPGAFIEDRE
jgi:homoserine kinase